MERTIAERQLAEHAVRELLIYLGEDPDREGLKDTPKRVVKSYQELFSGYQYTEEDIASTLTSFEDGACDELVLVKNVSFTSTCEHHLLPVIGLAHLAYLPSGRVVGLSKLARILDIYSRRLQLQERLCQQVTSALDRYLKPLGSACIVEAQHSCMSCRGVRKEGAVMITSSLTGEFKDDQSARLELLSLIKN